MSSPPVRVTFLFQGDSARHSLTDGTLYAREAEFRTAVDRCLDALGRLKADVAQVLGLGSISKKRVRSVKPRQLALFIYQYASAALLKSLGVQPSALLGEGAGELVAGCLAGVFRVEDALPLLETRTALAHSLRSGVGSVSHPPAVKRAITAYERSIIAIERRPPLVPLLSNPTAHVVGAAQAIDAAYWADRLCRQSCLSDGIAALLQTPPHVLVDVGPDEVLRTLAHNASPGPFGHTLISLGGDAGDAESRLLAGIGQLWTVGIDIHWASLDSRGRRRVPLPTYEFGGSELPDITATEEAPNGRFDAERRRGTARHDTSPLTVRSLLHRRRLRRWL